MGRADRKSPALHTRQVQSDAAHIGALERVMARKTATMAYRYAGGRYNHIWPDPSTAPYASLSAVETWTKFSVTDGTADGTTDWRAPWFHCHQYDSIKAIMILGSDHGGLKLFGRIYSDDLVDVVATTAGSAAECNYMSIAGIVGQDVMWRESINGIPAKMSYLTCSSTIASPTLPGTRRVALYPQVYAANSSSSHFDLSGTVKVWLKQMIIIDMPQPEAGM